MRKQLSRDSQSWLSPLRLVALVALAAAHVLVRDPSYTALTGAYGGTLAVLTALTWFRYARVRPSRLPGLECALFYHYLHYGLSTSVPPLELGIWSITPSPESHETAALLALLSGICMVAGHALLLGWLRDRTLVRSLPVLTGDQLVGASRIFIPISCAAIGLSVFSSGLQRALAVSIGTVLALFMGHVPLAVMASLAHLAKPSKATLIRLGVAFGVILLGLVVSSMLSPMLLSLGTVAVLWWLVKRRLPIALIGAGVALLLVLQPVKGFYRHVRTQSSEVGVVEGWQKAFSLATNLEAPSGSEATRSRLSELSVLAYAIQLVPDTIPHTGGKAYEMIPLTLIPRLVWPDKPNITQKGTDTFTITLGIQTEDWAQVSAMALSVPPHGWLEHGLAGTLLWMMIVGAIHGISAALFKQKAGEYAGLVGGSLTLGPLVFGYDSGFVAFVAGSIQWFILATLFIWVIHLLGQALTPRGIDYSSPRRPSRAPLS